MPIAVVLWSNVSEIHTGTIVDASTEDDGDISGSSGSICVVGKELDSGWG